MHRLIKAILKRADIDTAKLVALFDSWLAGQAVLTRLKAELKQHPEEYASFEAKIPKLLKLIVANMPKDAIKDPSNPTLDEVEPYFNQNYKAIQDSITYIPPKGQKQKDPAKEAQKATDKETKNLQRIVKDFLMIKVQPQLIKQTEVLAINQLEQEGLPIEGKVVKLDSYLIKAVSALLKKDIAKYAETSSFIENAIKDNWDKIKLEAQSQDVDISTANVKIVQEKLIPVIARLIVDRTLPSTAANFVRLFPNTEALDKFIDVSGKAEMTKEDYFDYLSAFFTHSKEENAAIMDQIEKSGDALTHISNRYGFVFTELGRDLFLKIWNERQDAPGVTVLNMYLSQAQKLGEQSGQKPETPKEGEDQIGVNGMQKAHYDSLETALNALSSAQGYMAVPEPGVQQIPLVPFLLKLAQGGMAGVSEFKIVKPGEEGFYGHRNYAVSDGITTLSKVGLLPDFAPSTDSNKWGFSVGARRKKDLAARNLDTSDCNIFHLLLVLLMEFGGALPDNAKKFMDTYAKNRGALANASPKEQVITIDRTLDALGTVIEQAKQQKKEPPAGPTPGGEPPRNARQHPYLARLAKERDEYQELWDKWKEEHLAEFNAGILPPELRTKKYVKDPNEPAPEMTEGVNIKPQTEMNLEKLYKRRRVDKGDESTDDEPSGATEYYEEELDESTVPKAKSKHAISIDAILNNVFSKYKAVYQGDVSCVIKHFYADAGGDFVMFDINCDGVFFKDSAPIMNSVKDIGALLNGDNMGAYDSFEVQGQKVFIINKYAAAAPPSYTAHITVLVPYSLYNFDVVTPENLKSTFTPGSQGEYYRATDDIRINEAQTYIPIQRLLDNLIKNFTARPLYIKDGDKELQAWEVYRSGSEEEKKKYPALMGMLDWVNTINERRFLVPTQVLMSYYYGSLGMLKYINAVVNQLATTEDVPDDTLIPSSGKKEQTFTAKKSIDAAKLDQKQFTIIKDRLESLIDTNNKIANIPEASKALAALSDKEKELEDKLKESRSLPRDEKSMQETAALEKELDAIQTQYDNLLTKAGLGKGLNLEGSSVFASLVPYLEDKGLLSVQSKELAAFEAYKKQEPAEKKDKPKSVTRTRKK